MKAKYVFYFVWFLIILLTVFTVYTGTPNIQRTFSIPTLYLGFFQRLVGMIALSLLPIQIILGSFMFNLSEKFGGWVFKFHITHAIFLYLLIFSHPLLYLILNYKAGLGFDPFYIFTDFCVMCRTRTDLYQTLGRLSFWLITIAYLAARYRTHPFLQKHWHKIHLLNFVTYFLVAVHAFYLGSNVHSKYYYWYFLLSIGVVLGILLYKAFKIAKKNTKIVK